MARLRRSVTVCAVMAAAGVVAAACTSDDAWQRTPVANQDPARSAVSNVADRTTSFEAALLAGAAQVGGVDDAALDADQLLKLTDVHPTAEIFADRPIRAAGVLRVEELLALWHGGGFGTDPPNAAVVIDDRVIAVELTGAAYDPAADSVVFSVRGLHEPGGAGGLAGRDGGSPDLLPVGEHTDVALFIDALPTVVNGQITDAVTQSNVKVLGDAPATAMGNLYQAVGSSLGLSAEQQQEALHKAWASTTTSVAALEAPPAGSGRAPALPGLTPAEWAVLTAG